MNSRTHTIGGICSGVVASTILYADTFTVGSLVTSGLIIYGSSIGSIIPDIDHPTSKLGRKFLLRPISIVINKVFGHRTITHSLISTVVFSFLLLLTTYLFEGVFHYIYSNLIIGICVGYLSHLLLDSFTVKGIPIYYPFSSKTYKLFNFKTGKDEELVSMIILLLTGLFIITYFTLY